MKKVTIIDYGLSNLLSVQHAFAYFGAETQVTGKAEDVLAADALVSVGVLVSGLVISWTGWTVVDPIVGLVVAAVIVASVWSLTRASLRLSLDGVPDGIRVDELERMMTAVPGVEAVHHIHVWAISTTENALTAHVVLTDLPRLEAVKRELKTRLNGAGVHHASLEFESVAENCCDFSD